MKFLLLAALVSVAVAAPNGLVTPGAAGPAPVIIDEFEPIAIGPAVIDSFEPIAIGPAIVPEPIAVGPAIVDTLEPISVGPEIVDFPVPTPVITGPAAPVAPSATAPLVQIILNINAAASTPVAPIGVVGPAPTPVHVVDSAPEPVQVVEIAPEPVQVVETAPVPVEPVIIGTPIIPSPAVVLPDELN